MKSKKKTEQPGIEEPALKRNKKKGKESRVAGESWEEVSFSSELDSTVGEIRVEVESVRRSTLYLAEP